jgi:hypothetical protein
MSDSNNMVGAAVEAVKDRLTNRLYMYMFSSVIITNWQHILIIIKSKNDIELTLGIMTFEPSFAFLYFILPVIFGTILAIAMPYCTRFVVELTASQYFLIKNSDVLGKTDVDIKIAKKKHRLSTIELQNENNEAEIKRIKSNNDILQSQSSAYYKWLQGVLKAYNETGGKINTPDDLKRMLLKLKEYDAVYDMELLPKFKKLMDDIQRIEDVKTEGS